MHKNAYFIRYAREKKKIKANCRHPQPLKNVLKKKAGGRGGGNLNCRKKFILYFFQN